MSDMIQKTTLGITTPQSTYSSAKEGAPDQSFQSLLPDAEAKPIKRPNMIQFMAATGASVEQARDALFVHKNWQHYLPGWDGSLETVAAFNQVQEEQASGIRTKEQKWSAPLLDGTRSLDAETIGATKAFQQLDGPMADAGGGQVLPSFFESPTSSLHNQLASFAIMRADGTVATKIMPHNRDYGSTDPSIPFGPAQSPTVAKNQFAQEVFAFGLGEDALDDFAKRFGADDWKSLDWALVQNEKNQSAPLMKDDWIKQHGTGHHVS